MEQRSPEWFEARKGRITASIVGAILGRSPNMTREAAMRAMVRDAVGAESEFTGNIATEYGVNNEEHALFDYTLETLHDVETVGFITKEDWAGCSPDALIEHDGGVEIKCPFGKRNDANPEFKTLAEQPHYYDQVQFSLWVTGREWWDFFQWSRNGNAIETVYVDHAWQDENLPKLRQFYAEYLDALKDPTEYLGELRVTIDTPSAAKIVAEYDELTTAIENATARKKELLDDMVRMANGANATIAGRKLTKVEKAGAVSYAKAIAKYAPDADLEPFRGKPSSSWRLS